MLLVIRIALLVLNVNKMEQVNVIREIVLQDMVLHQQQYLHAQFALLIVQLAPLWEPLFVILMVAKQDII